MIGGRYMATKLSSSSASQISRAPGLTGLFNRQISVISRPTSEHKPIRATGGALRSSSPAVSLEAPSPALSMEVLSSEQPLATEKVE